MGILKKAALFCIGGSGYVGLELLWRRRSHSSMFLAGGTCFLLLGRLSRQQGLSTAAKGALGSGIITAVELASGLLFNRDHRVWDYRKLPGQLFGQICLPFSLLWVPVSLGAMAFYRLTEHFPPFRLHNRGTEY